MIRSAWCSFQRGKLSLCHCLAKCSKVFNKAACRAALASCLALLGSCPCAIMRRAFSAAWRASTNEKAGYFPIVSVFSLPAKRYFRRNIFPPAGVTSRYKPLPSNNLVFFPVSDGLAALIWRSFRGIGGMFLGGIDRFPESYPHLLLYSIKRHWGYLDTW